ncbi:MAG: diguanylate cyclase [Nitrospirae bacterium]|nr:diguanylate cyclase [Nitrospirota bacterium]
MIEGRYGLLTLLLKTIAQKDNLCIQCDGTLKDLISLMNVNKKGVVVILNENKAVGILTERDVVEILYNGVDMSSRIDCHSKRPLVVTKGDRTIGYALNLTLENNIRRVIVADDEGNFLGIVTQQDLLKYLEEDFYRLTIKVKHILKKTGSLISVSPDTTLNIVLQQMIQHKISAVPVIKDNKALGIVTEKDILKLTCENVSLKDHVGKYMSSPVETVNLDTPLAEIVEVMNYEGIRRVVVVDKDGAAVNIVTIRDVMENLEGDYNRFIEGKLKTAREILNLLPEMLIEVVDVGSEHLVIWANDKVIGKFGKEILDKPVTNFIPKENWERISATLNKLHKIERIKFKKEDRIFELSGFLLKTFGDNEQGRYQLIMRDITEDIKLSTVDPLTNIYNRRFINGFLMKEIERCKRTNSHFSIVISDIDDFKIINDTYGHLAGDLALKAVSQIIVDTVRNLDVVGRYGGDEFMIILPETSSDIASYVIDRLRCKIENLEISLPKGLAAKITCSFGIATFPDDGTGSDDLLVTADERLYKAKSMGKNKIACV